VSENGIAPNVYHHFPLYTRYSIFPFSDTPK